jgi:hypothetical protein
MTNQLTLQAGRRYRQDLDLTFDGNTDVHPSQDAFAVALRTALQAQTGGALQLAAMGIIGPTDEDSSGWGLSSIYRPALSGAVLGPVGIITTIIAERVTENWRTGVVTNVGFSVLVDAVRNSDSLHLQRAVADALPAGMGGNELTARLFAPGTVVTRMQESLDTLDASGAPTPSDSTMNPLHRVRVHYLDFGPTPAQQATQAGTSGAEPAKVANVPDAPAGARPAPSLTPPAGAQPMVPQPAGLTNTQWILIGVGGAAALGVVGVLLLGGSPAPMPQMMPAYAGGGGLRLAPWEDPPPGAPRAPRRSGGGRKGGGRKRAGRRGR